MLLEQKNLRCVSREVDAEVGEINTMWSEHCTLHISGEKSFENLDWELAAFRSFTDL